MRRSSFIICLILSLVATACTSGPPENPDGKYGSDVPVKEAITMTEVISRQGQYLDHKVVVTGEIIKVDDFSGAWFDLKSGSDTVRCSIADFNIPQSLTGKKICVTGTLSVVQVATEKGRDPGGEYTFSADPSSAKYKDELRIEVEGIQVEMQQPAGSPAK
jgi:hypothetical protein